MVPTLPSSRSTPKATAQQIAYDMSVTLITGPPGSGKTRRLLVGYRQLLGDCAPGSGLWLVPNWRAGAALRWRLLDGPPESRIDGCFSPGVMTFRNFAEAVLESSAAAVRPLNRLMKRRLVGSLIDRRLSTGRLEHFSPIASTTGLIDLICDFISELKRLEIWPDQFRAACTARGLGRRDSELIDLYESYQQSLTDHQLYDDEGRLWSARDRLQKEQPHPLRNLRRVVVDGFTDFTRTQHEILQILADRVEELLITLPLEPEPRREGAQAVRKPPPGTSGRRHRGHRDHCGRSAVGRNPADRLANQAAAYRTASSTG